MAEKTQQTSPSLHLFADVLARVHAICASLAEEGNWPAGIDYSRVVVEPPRDASHGDMATNAAMVLAKEAKAKPRDLAEAIAARLRADELIDSVDVAGPGFINLTLKKEAWAEELRTVLREGEAYGRIAPLAAARVRRTVRSLRAWPTSCARPLPRDGRRTPAPSGRCSHRRRTVARRRGSRLSPTRWSERLILAVLRRTAPRTAPH